MKLVKKINVELNRKGFPKEIDVVQYDTGLQLKCIVKDFDIPDGTIATLYAEKPSGKFVYQQEGIEISDNTIIVDLENQAITEHGKVWMQITLSNGTDTISTFEMLMKVQKSRKDSGAVESTTVIRAFDEAIEKAVAQINEARDAASKYISESVDQSLSIAGKAADAAAVGKKVTELNENISNKIKSSIGGKNILDDSKSVNGYLENGVLTQYGTWKTTPLIDVSNLATVKYVTRGVTVQTWSVYDMNFLSLYDENGNYLRTEGNVSGVYTIPSDVRFIRFCYKSDVVTDNMVMDGSVSDITYEVYFEENRLNNSPYVEKGEESCDYYISHVLCTNILDSEKIVDGYLGSDGNIIPNSSSTHYSSTGYIYVENAKNVYFSASEDGGTSRIQGVMYFVCGYDENYNFIQKFADVVPAQPYTLPIQVKYLRFSFRNDYNYSYLALEKNKMIRSRKFRPYEEKNILSTYSNYKWAVIGDSLTEGNQRTNTNYHDYIHEKLGITVLNYGASGTGYKRTEDENKAFYQRISNIDTTADVATIFGSGNDMLYVSSSLGDINDKGTDTLCGCINTTIDNLYEIMPTVQLGIITPCPWKDYNPSDDTNPMALYSAKLVEICKARGIPYLDLYHCSNLRPWDANFRELCYSNDDGNGTHPDELGHKIIASRIEEFIKSLLL